MSTEGTDFSLYIAAGFAVVTLLFSLPLVITVSRVMKKKYGLNQWMTMPFLIIILPVFYVSFANYIAYFTPLFFGLILALGIYGLIKTASKP